MVSNVKFQEVVWSNPDWIKQPGATSRADKILYENISTLLTIPEDIQRQFCQTES